MIVESSGGGEGISLEGVGDVVAGGVGEVKVIGGVEKEVEGGDAVAAEDVCPWQRGGEVRGERRGREGKSGVVPGIAEVGGADAVVLGNMVAGMNGEVEGAEAVAEIVYS